MKRFAPISIVLVLALREEKKLISQQRWIYSANQVSNLIFVFEKFAVCIEFMCCTIFYDCVCSLLFAEGTYEKEPVIRHCMAIENTVARTANEKKKYETE